MSGESIGHSSNVVKAASEYLRRTAGAFVVGRDEYYARSALEQAVMARLEGNYGIGAVAIVVGDREVAEFPAQNAMLTGVGVIDHAETRAVLAVLSSTAPANRYLRTLTEATAALPRGLSVYGSVEPCPMCACAMTNAGVIRSISTARDGKIVTVDGIPASDGGSTVLGDKSRFQPEYWRWIQERTGMRFDTAANVDADLQRLSWEVFAEVASETTELLIQRRLDDRRRDHAAEWRKH